MAEWVDALLPIIDEFIATYQGKVNLKFWDMCVKAHPSRSSGGGDALATSNGLSGWVLNFFPYSKGRSPYYSSLKDIEKVHDSRTKNQEVSYRHIYDGEEIPSKYEKVKFLYQED